MDLAERLVNVAEGAPGSGRINAAEVAGDPSPRPAGLTGPPEQLEDDQWEFTGECGALASSLWTLARLVAWPDSDDEVRVLRGCYVFTV